MHSLSYVPGRWVCVCVLALVLATLSTVAHEIPADIYTTVFVKPSGERLQVLVRVPLAAVRDFVYPEQEGSFLDFEALEPQLPELAQLWIGNQMEVFANDKRLNPPQVVATQLSLASNRSFAGFPPAQAHSSAEQVSNGVEVVWNQLWFDVFLEYQIPSESANLALRTGFERLAMRVSATVRFLPPNGTERVYSLHMEGGDGDVDLLPLDPRWHQAAGSFVAMGFEHILE